MQISTEKKNPDFPSHWITVSVWNVEINTLTKKKKSTPALWFNWQDRLNRCSRAGQGYCLMADNNGNVLRYTGQKKYKFNFSCILTYFYHLRKQDEEVFYNNLE